MRNLKTLNEEISRMKSLFRYKKGTSNVDDLIIYEQENLQTETENCIEIIHTGTFAATKSESTQPFNDFIAKMQSEINNNPELKKQIEEGGEVYITELKIMGGASNIYKSKATAADVENDYTTPYDDSIKKDSGYEANVGYAKSRAENLLNAMVNKLPEMSIKLIDGLLDDAKNNIVTKVINTGGKSDKNRTKTTYINPGQIVKIEMKICADPERPEILKCFESAIIEVSYDATSNDQTHVCNNAVYQIFANGLPLKSISGNDYASLNNKTKPNDYPSDKSEGKNARGGTYEFNYFKLDIDGNNRQFFNQEFIYKYDGGLVISAKCMKTKYGKWQGGTDCHEWVGDIKLQTTSGVEVVDVGKSDLPGTGLTFSTPNTFDVVANVAGFEACKNLPTK